MSVFDNPELIVSMSIIPQGEVCTLLPFNDGSSPAKIFR